MQSTIVMFARKPLPRPIYQPSRRPRRNLLARLRDQIAILRMIDLDYTTIGKTLRISEEDVRALSPKTNQPATARKLKRHAIRALVKGRHARIGGQTIPARAKNLLKIASAYSRQELLEEPGVGAVTAMEIQLWLEERGYALRDEDSQHQLAQ